MDGVPLFKTSPVKFWPHLGRFRKKPVFMIALYRGEKDLQEAAVPDYLRDFVDEVLPYLRNGIELNGRTYNFHLHCMLADSPARAAFLGIQQATGYFSCSKCKVRGERAVQRTCFPSVEEYEAR